MSCKTRYKSRLTAALCGPLLALAFVSLCSAQAHPAADAVSTNKTSTAVQGQLQTLQDEVNALQGEIAALKQQESATPSVKPAAFVEPVLSETAIPSASSAPAAPETAPSPEAAPKVTLASLLGPTSLNGLVDAYYSYDFNHPTNPMQTGLRFFDANENQFALSLVELGVSKSPDATSGIAGRTGYTVSLGFGQTISAVNGTDGTASSAPYLKEAYFSYLAPIGKGLKIDVGKFVTTAGEEVIESNANWNYSRSILFYYAIPFYHFGVRASYSPNSKVSLQASITNGWNDVVAFNNAKTYGGSISITPNSKWGFTETYYAGPVNNINYWRQLSDTIISYTPDAKWAFAINGDYGRDSEGPSSPVAQWWGPAGYVKYNFGANDNLAVRYEYYGDPQGLTLFGNTTFNGGAGFPSGHAQEVTTTYTHMIANSLVTRFEYRYDFASNPIFQRGDGSLGNFVKTQNTVLVGMVYTFSSQGK
ncbi:MAG TPA: porin [Patescibacteria group bacterium]|nr:porin [Patescibacteria group bacterium]